MKNTTTIKYLKDYQQPNYWANSVALEFNICDDTVIVTSVTRYYKNQHTIARDLIIFGSSKLLTLYVDQQEISDYSLRDEELSLHNLPDEFTLTVQSEVDAFNNKSCMGLYASQGSLFTQCEPEGFRKITYYQDRPDVMAVFTTTIIASPEIYPVVLSNGNQISQETLADGRVKTTWHDPFKKPSYLFALVAGKFSKISDTFITKSGEQVLVEVYSEADSISQCQHCLDSAKRAMLWDEQRFNLEYDLERYMIVASGDFNMGAMENKGLNVFNTKYVLAESKTATDTDFINVEAVVGHEYFHNWTGNRVTCRDWFQLSLKEGLTVFRDQEFTSDLHSAAVERIQNVKTLRQAQFSEDASPLSHPVRPASYLEINNFYTVTVYEKGAEVVRMYQTILGKDGFKRGMELYFARHDGQAVSCDDFCNAMADANNFDLSQFMLWYSQAGTPQLTITDNYDATNQEYTLNIQQIIPDSAGQQNKAAMLIPLELGLMAADGTELAFATIVGEVIQPENDKQVLLIRDFQQKYVFKVAKCPTPSLLRNFSAPVIVNYAYSNEQLVNLAAHDKDSFNRWEALQVLFKHTITDLYNGQSAEAAISTELVVAVRATLNDNSLDETMRSLSVTLPGFAELCASFKNVDVHQLVAAIDTLQTTLADQLSAEWLQVYQQQQTSSYQVADAGKRALKNTALNYLLSGTRQANYLALCQQQYTNADNMTDKIAALQAINDSDTPLRTELLHLFQQEYATYPLVMDKWFMLQSLSRREDTLSHVKQLLNHPQFDKTNPNKLYALIRAFTANPLHFNSAEGYQFIADEILRVDKFNSSVAGRIAHGFSIITKLAPSYQAKAKPVLTQILATEGLSNDVFELISKTAAELK